MMSIQQFPPLRHRQVHLDFHTSEAISGIGRDFDEERFIATLRSGDVDSVTMFAMCHHGWCYYPTQVGAPHPHLETDLLGRMLAACKTADIEAPVYITVGWNERSGREHPEWLMLDREGRLPNVYGPGNRLLTPDELAALPPDTPKPWGWQRLCNNTGYLDYLLAITREVMERYRPVGIFYDITGEEPCFCPKCRADMATRGINLDDAKAVTAFAQEVYKTYLRRTSELIWGIAPTTRLYHNGTDRKGRDDLYQYFSHYEIESLPTSFWGYEHFPPNAAYFPVKGMDCLGMTGKFHLMWGEFGGYKNPDALRYECARMLAYGTKCSVGDQMPPSGTLDPETYRIIGAGYRHVAERETWSRGATSMADVGVLCPTAVTGIKDEPGNEAEMGVASVLGEGHVLYAMLDATMEFSPYRVLILPDCVPVDATLRAKLETYLADGGKLLLSGTSGLDPDGKEFQVDTGAAMIGPSPWDVDFTLAGLKLAKGLVASPFLNYLPGRKTKVTTGKALATMVAPCFNRTFGHFCSHGVTPPSGEDAGYPAVVRNRAGTVVYLANPIFGQYCRKGMQLHRDLALNALALLLPKPSIAVTGLPSGGLITMHRRAAEKDWILHLLYGVPVKRGETRVIEDLPTLSKIKVTLRLPQAVSAVRLVPEGRDLKFRIGRDGKVTFTLPRLAMHQMIQVTWREEIQNSKS